MKREFTTLEKSLVEDPTCYRCFNDLPPAEDGYPAQREGCLQVHLIGGYGQFHDMIELDGIIGVYLCHDCSAELFRFMRFNPRLQTDMRGLHPYDKEGEPCCEFGWVGTEAFGSDSDEPHVLFGFEDKKSKRLEGE